MIKIKKKHSDDFKKIYYSEIVKIIQENDPGFSGKITFLNGYSPISLDKLLTYDRKDILEIPGIKEYIAFCKFVKLAGSDFTQADFLSFLHQSFPEDIKCKEINDYLIYTTPTNVEAKVRINSKKRTVSGQITQFFKYFYRKITTTPPHYNKFPVFINNAKNDINNLLVPNIDNRINYDWMPSTLRHEILADLNIKCCPYCNRQYITIWTDKENQIHSTADLDHYYQKKVYPLFALSLFNFVPSCQICNSRMKGSKQLDTLYPYEESMDKAHFHCVPKNGMPDRLVDMWLGYNLNDPNKLLEMYELNLEEDVLSESSSDYSHIERIRGSIEMFRLKEVYKTHLDTALNEIINIRIYLSGAYKKYAENTFKEIIKNRTENKFSEEEMRNIILGFVYDGQNNLDQPLGKLLSDIFEYEMKIKQLCNKK